MKRQRRRAVGLLRGTLLALAVFLAAVWTGCGEGQVDNSDERGVAAYEEGDDVDPSTMGDDEFNAMMAEENQSAGMEEAGGARTCRRTRTPATSSPYPIHCRASWASSRST